MVSHAISRRMFVFDLIPKNTIGCEIGVWVGQFTYQLLNRTNPKMLHLIDHWKWSKGFNRESFKGERVTSQEVMDKIHDFVYANHGHKPNVKIHRGRSDEVYKAFKNNYFDWIYVDGNHSFNGVLSDLTLYYPKVKPGGIIIGDDYNISGGRVRRAVKQFTNEKGLNYKHKAEEYWFYKK